MRLYILSGMENIPKKMFIHSILSMAVRGMVGSRCPRRLHRPEEGGYVEGAGDEGEPCIDIAWEFFLEVHEVLAHELDLLKVKGLGEALGELCFLGSEGEGRLGVAIVGEDEVEDGEGIGEPAFLGGGGVAVECFGRFCEVFPAVAVGGAEPWGEGMEVVLELAADELFGEVQVSLGDFGGFLVAGGGVVGMVVF